MKTSRKNILFVEANVDGTIGGSHHCLTEILKNLNKKVYKPSVLFLQNNDLVPIFEKYGNVHIFRFSKGICLNRYAKGRISNRIIAFPQKIVNFAIAFLIDVLRVSLFLYQNKIDLVHLNNGPMQLEIFVASKILRKKIISHLRGTFHGRIPYMIQGAIPFYDALIPISRSVENYTRSLSSSLPKMHLIFDGIDVEAVYNQHTKLGDEIKEEFKVKEGQPFVCLVNNIKEWKGQHVVIDAINLLKHKYPDILCLLVGNVADMETDVKYFHYLKQQVDKYGLNGNIVFTGYRRDVVDIISSIDIVLHSSIANEGFPRVILEAMTLGKPIIASSIGPNMEIISDGKDGLLFKVNDHQDLASKINYLIMNPEKRKVLGHNAFNKIKEHFHIKNNVGKIESLYQEIL